MPAAPPPALALSRPAAATLLLAAQGLLAPPPAGAARDDVRAAIRRMHALQIDTIHVVARSPYLVLWSRLGDYRPVWLDELLAEGALFEYWAHAACLLPAEDYGLHRRLVLDGVRRFERSEQWLARNPATVARILDHIRERGAVRSAEFTRVEGPGNGWWDWKPEKQALEYLHNVGVLMTARRQNFQRLYDLRERVRPEWDDAHAPPAEQARRRLALMAVAALGVATAAWSADYFRTPRTGEAARLAALADEGALLPVSVAGVAGPAYILPETRPLAERAAAGDLAATATTLLSPFDPVVWQRERARALFGFDYRIECYTPAPKRRYGYFTLPVLHRGALVGRLDPKAHRREGRFEVKALHLEPGVALTDDLLEDLAGALQRCAAWHGTPEVVIAATDPPEVGPRLTAALARAGG
jgi:uncharacterized protein